MMTKINNTSVEQIEDLFENEETYQYFLKKFLIFGSKSRINQYSPLPCKGRAGLCLDINRLYKQITIEWLRSTEHLMRNQARCYKCLLIDLLIKQKVADTKKQL